MKCNCISFILHINICLYIHNAIAIVNTAAVRGYINCISLYNKGANLPKPLRGKDLYQLHFSTSTYVNPFIC